MEETKKMAQTTTNTSAVVVGETTQEKPLSMGRRILYHLWDNDQHLKTPEERKLVRKLDFGILICATLGWVCQPFSYFQYALGESTANKTCSG